MKKNFFAAAVGMGGLALLLTTNACKENKPTPPPTPAKTPSTGGTTPITTPAPGEPGKALVSAEKNSFQAVTSKLDAGGNLYAYVGTEQWLNNISQKAGEFFDMFRSIPGPDRREREQIGAVLDMIQRLIKGSGVESISGVGWSGIAIEKGFYRNKFVLHHYPGQAKGNLWSVFGAKAHPLYSLDLLPTNTALAFFTDLEVEEVWTTVEKEAISSGIPELADGIRAFPDMFKQAIGLEFDKTRASLGGEIGLILTLDDSKPVKIPLPDRMSLSVPTFGLMISVKVVDDLIFNRIDQQLTKDPNLSQMVQRIEETDLKMRIVQLPMPLPIPVRPTLARHGDYLLLATSDDLIRAAVSAKTGKSPGLKSTAEFKQLARDIPTQGNNFAYVSTKLGETLTSLLQEVGQQMGRREPAASAMMTKMAGMLRVPHGYAVGANTPEGWVETGNSSKDPSIAYFTSNLMTPVATVGLLSAIAIPNFVKARSTAQRNACINNLRQLEGAKQQWALENKKTQADTPTWSDLVGTDRYIKVRPRCPANGRYTIGPMSEKPRCSDPTHSLEFTRGAFGER